MTETPPGGQIPDIPPLTPSTMQMLGAVLDDTPRAIAYVSLDRGDGNTMACEVVAPSECDNPEMELAEALVRAIRGACQTHSQKLVTLVDQLLSGALR